MARVLRAVLAGLVLALLMTGVSMAKAHAATTSASCAWWHYPRWPLHNYGNHTYDSSHRMFIPNGMTIEGLTWPSPTWESSVPLDEQRMVVAEEWCANVARIQIAQANFFNPDHTVNQTYLADLETEVEFAHSHNMGVVLSDQTQKTANLMMPNWWTLQMWRDLAPWLSHQYGVIIEPFNEPHPESYYGITQSAANAQASILSATGSRPDPSWSCWQHGCWMGGWHYLGMQEMVDDLRLVYHNVLWIDGPAWADDLRWEPHYPVYGSNLVFDIHYPAGVHTIAQWQDDFGDLAARVPVTVGEYGNNSNWYPWLCWADAYSTQSVGRFLDYVHSLRIGLTGWTLSTGHLVQNQTTWTPTTIDPDYSCQIVSSWAARQDEGAGSLIQSLFQSEP